MRNLRINITFVVAIIALLGLAGRLDYIAEREAECASYVRHHRYDEATDTCVRVDDNQPPTDQEYYASPEKSRP